jgi:outer membrane receptor for ferrienterochelin and colicins
MMALARTLGSHSRCRRAALAMLVAWLLLVPAANPARAQALPDLDLEQLMGIDAGRVFGASERMQPVTEAPSSVSFITADEIAHQGYRSLADILRGVRGLYVTNDRNFSLLGARGFGKPGDYNSRILLLVNGHRVNDNVFGQAEIGPEMGLDPAMFERVEIIRGPASSLYGDSAFFAVVNVITKTGASLERGSVTMETGTLGTRLVRGTSGHRFGNGVELAFSGTLEGSTGVERLYFPAFDSPATNFGIAQGLDGEHLGAFYTQATAGRFTFTGAYGRRRRDVPTASFGTVFNEQVFRQETVDRHLLADLEYARPIGGGRLSIRGAYDRFSYDGIYPFVAATADTPGLVAESGALGARWSIGGRISHPLRGRQVLTVGAEFIDNVSQNQWGRYLDPPETLYATDRSTLQHAAYVQDEIKLARWLIVNAGARYDRYEAFDRVTPRAALIVTPSPAQSFKYLFGQAFRAPNAYEQNDFVFGEQTQRLRPETIDTHEVVWERYTNDWLRTSVSTYWYKADRLITLIPDPSTFIGTTYANEGQVRALGLELEAQMRLAHGVQGVMSYALQRTRDRATRTTLVNSPAQTAKVRLSAPLPAAGASISAELIAIGRRRTLAGNTLGATATTDLAVSVPLGRSLELTGSARNLLDRDYSDPASSNHLQDDIPQNGRTLRVGLRWSPWSN